MRKNGINRELRPIEGGVCAPEGYQANGVACGIRADGGLDLAIIFSPRRCSVACLYANGNTVGAPVKVSRKNMRNGYARAVLVNGGVANALRADGERFSLAVCDLLFPYGIERTEIVNASTGDMGGRLELCNFERGIKPLWEGLGSSEVHSRRVAESLSSTESMGKQLAFSFDLGDYPCKMGVVFKGGKHVSPNMATFLAFLTTDVNISTPMLQKALASEVKETLNLLNLDGATSPNDTVCIFANGKAGNYRIDCVDSEYKKFKYALRAVLTEICKATAKEGGKKLLACRVCGAISKEVSRAVSKAVVGTECFKDALGKGCVDVDGLLCRILASANAINVADLRIALRSTKGELALYEDERSYQCSEEAIAEVLSAEEIEISVDLQEGNFQSVAYGCL